MRRLALSLLGALALALGAAAPAGADFGFSEFDVTFNQQGGATANQAGSHPFEMHTDLRFISHPTGEGGEETDEQAKDIIVAQVPGFIGNPTAVPQCPTAQFLTAGESLTTNQIPDCPDASVIGVVAVELSSKIGSAPLFSPVYNLEPPPGVAAKIGFWTGGVPVPIDLGVRETPPYNVLGGPTNISQLLEVLGSELTLWGVPADPLHDPLRGRCISSEGISADSCEAGISPRPFLTLPRACAGPLKTEYEIDSWQSPGAWVKGFAETHNSSGTPEGMKGCGRLGFGPETAADPTTASAESASGLDFSIDVDDENLDNPDYEAVADADIEKIVTTLPAGVTANPSAAEGLGTCSPAQFGAASLALQGCPDASKLGTIEADSPILENHTLHGAVYLATQDDPSTPQTGAENPFDSLFALYFVIRDPQRGVFVKLAARVDPDPQSGRLITTVEDLPPFPLAHVGLHLRPGPRAPLITPPACGTYATTSLLYPSSGAAPLEDTSTFTIASGPGGAPCPAGLPFSPRFAAGSRNNAASHYSPFDMRITRRDGEGDLTRFSALLPGGVVPKLAGIPKCPDAAIEAAKQRTGRAEQAAPSCPAASRLGSLLAGAGVGSELTYVPGSLYFAGPYKGAPMSVAAIVPAVAGPFDVGTVITRVGLDLNPVTYRGEVDGSASDPIPHILEGIPLKLRDLRVFADRPEFTLNPTSCRQKQTDASLGGSGANPLSAADDVLATAIARFQAASCGALRFRPKLALQLRGGTKRGSHPALRSTVTYPYPSGPGYANIGKAVVTLPPTEFIDNAHINNPCTRVQFNANACPKSSILGTARAITPLLDEPLEGSVYFRSNGGERKLPDVVADLHGLVRITLVGFVDTATPKRNPRIRTTFSQVPDAPVTSFKLNLFGGKRGLLVNSANLCRKRKLRATLELSGQNGRRHDTRPAVKTSCKHKKRKGSRHHRR